MAERISVVEQVLGIDNPGDRDRSLSQAIEALSGERNARQTVSRILNSSGQTQEEWSIDLTNILELLRGEVGGTSTLTDWPTYVRLLRDNGQVRRDGHATALLIGAYSAISSRSFECLARTEYGADKVLIVDPVTGEYKRRHGKFIYGSGTQLPIVDGSVDFVHTNRLMHMLYDPSDPDRPSEENQLRLFSEIGRVAIAGGQVLMKEFVPGVLAARSGHAAARITTEYGNFVSAALRRVGFTQVHADVGNLVRGAASAQDLTKPLFDAARPIDIDPEVRDVSTIEVYARKST